MKRILYFTAWFIMTVMVSCSHEPGSFTVRGKFDNAPGRALYLYKMTTEHYISIDSAETGPDGGFELHGTAGHTGFFALQFNNDDYLTLLAGPGDMIELEGDADDLPGTYRVYGSEASEKIRQLSQRLEVTLDQIYDLNKVFNDSSRSPDFLKIKDSLDIRYGEILESQKDFTLGFIRDNPNSLASLMALYQQIGPRRYLLDPVDDFPYFSMLDSTLGIRFPESEAVGELHRQVEELKEKNAYLKGSEKFLAKGMEAPEIALPSPGGDTILLSSLRGKIVLLDFWASWCDPCRDENPDLVRIYRQYKDKGFDIYQVSLDKSRTSWLRAIREDSLGWVQVSDLKMWESAVVGAYNLRGIPMNFLLDRQGRIIAKNLKGSMLKNKLEELYNED